MFSFTVAFPPKCSGRGLANDNPIEKRPTLHCFVCGRVLSATLRCVPPVFVSTYAEIGVFGKSSKGAAFRHFQVGVLRGQKSTICYLYNGSGGTLSPALFAHIGMKWNVHVKPWRPGVLAKEQKCRTSPFRIHPVVSHSAPDLSV